MVVRVLITLLLLVAVPAGAGPLVKSGQGRVVDGDTLFLDDRAQVRLVGIRAPKLPLGRRNFKAWPLVEEAKRVLEALTLGRMVHLSYGGRRTDRYGHALAHLHRAGWASGYDPGQWPESYQPARRGANQSGHGDG